MIRRISADQSLCVGSGERNWAGSGPWWARVSAGFLQQCGISGRRESTFEGVNKGLESKGLLGGSTSHACLLNSVLKPWVSGGAHVLFIYFSFGLPNTREVRRGHQLNITVLTKAECPYPHLGSLPHPPAWRREGKRWAL